MMWPFRFLGICRRWRRIKVIPRLLVAALVLSLNVFRPTGGLHKYTIHITYTTIARSNDNAGLIAANIPCAVVNDLTRDLTL